jgi:hypothetical protein
MVARNQELLPTICHSHEVTRARILATAHDIGSVKYGSCPASKQLLACAGKNAA